MYSIGSRLTGRSRKLRSGILGTLRSCICHPRSFSPLNISLMMSICELALWQLTLNCVDELALEGRGLCVQGILQERGFSGRSELLAWGAAKGQSMRMVAWTLP